MGSIPSKIPKVITPNCQYIQKYVLHRIHNYSRTPTFHITYASTIELKCRQQKILFQKENSLNVTFWKLNTLIDTQSQLPERKTISYQKSTWLKRHFLKDWPKVQ